MALGGEQKLFFFEGGMFCFISWVNIFGKFYFLMLYLLLTYTNICNILGEFCFLMLHLLLKYTHMLLNKGELMIVDQRETSN